MGGQGWRIGESTRLSPMQDQFPASTPYVGLSSLLLVLFLALRGFPSGTPVFPSPQNPAPIFSFQFD